MICPTCKKTVRSAIDYARVQRYGECTECAVHYISLEDLAKKAKEYTKEIQQDPLLNMYKIFQSF